MEIKVEFFVRIHHYYILCLGSRQHRRPLRSWNVQAGGDGAKLFLRRDAESLFEELHIIWITDVFRAFLTEGKLDDYVDGDGNRRKFKWSVNIAWVSSTNV